MEKFTEYGLQNVASNFAYDTDQEFFRKPLAIHGAAFMVGGIGSAAQDGIMGEKFFQNEFSRFGARFLTSGAAYFAEYSTNYYFKTKMQQVKYGDFRKNKGASFGIKSWAYSWLYSLD